MPVALDTAGHALGGVTFALDIDEPWVTFDPTDGDRDGIPEAVAFHVPSGYVVHVRHAPTVTDGELEFSVDARPGVTVPLADGVIVDVLLAVGPRPASPATGVRFGGSTQAQFWDLADQRREGGTVGDTRVPESPPSTVVLPSCQASRP